MYGRTISDLFSFYPCLNAGVLTGHKNCRDKIVRELVPFTASVLLKASKNSDDGNDMEVLLSGVAPLSDEISWLKQEAARGDVPLFNVIVL